MSKMYPHLCAVNSNSIENDNRWNRIKWERITAGIMNVSVLAGVYLRNGNVFDQLCYSVGNFIIISR
jgi:hypothetical protein